MPKEKCGICGVHYFDQKGSKNVSPHLYKLLLNLQHRGQLSAGITSYDSQNSEPLRTYKRIGSVNEVFKLKVKGETHRLFEKYSGASGIGHVRYATSGEDTACYAHPYERIHGRRHKWFSICFNGNIANIKELTNELNGKGYHLKYNSDTEVMMHYISRYLSHTTPEDLPTVFRKFSKVFDGSYCLAFIDAMGRIAAVRDPLGNRPLCFAVDKEKIVFASESVALKNIGMHKITHIKPGEMLIIEGDSYKLTDYTTKKKPARCMFEYVYFANVATNWDDKVVYEVRENFGKLLAGQEDLDMSNNDEYVVVAVPDSAKPVGETYAYELGLRNQEGLVRNRYIGRTFISDGGRRERVKMKFSIIPEIIRGKKIIMVDDSVVRGTTSQQLVSYVKKEGGAKEVHLRIACPPVVSPCFYGIDMSTISELLAPEFIANLGKDPTQKELDAISDYLGADSLKYLTIDNLAKGIGFPKSELCMGCVDGKYPTKAGTELYQKSLDNYKNNKSGRTYE